MYNAISSFIKDNEKDFYTLLKELCLIPAPSHKEEKRADYVKKVLESYGAKGVYTDEALNVIYPVNCDGKDNITVFVAHTDTVFPDTEPMPYKEDEEKIYCPGVGDDTVCVAQLLMVAKYITENNIPCPQGMLLVFNSCEEGLGDLKGTKTLFKNFERKIGRFISLDSWNLNRIADRCAGSHRYEVEVLTEGGHSYNAFGNTNAIAELSKIINEIYSIKVPEKNGLKTTYNVGGISGGTSVNTIAQSAKMLCEYRSEDKDCLEIMRQNFMRIFENSRSDKVDIKVSKIGDRPCGDISEDKIDELKNIIVPIVEEVTGNTVVFESSSTDCNIPLSLGIPAICIGTYNGGGTHTREEWVEKKSLMPGLEIALKIVIECVRKDAIEN